MSEREPWTRRALGVTVIVCGVVAFPAVAPATVEEQRARLPPPAVCRDPIEGVWASHKWEPPYNEWMIFTLEIRRNPGRAPSAEGALALTGRITAQAWIGAGPRAVQPPPCFAGLQHWIVEMTAEGSARGLELEFHGTRWWLQQSLCGSRYFGYNLDHFSGTIEPERQEFQSVNNDGGRSINDPTVFRRVRCYEAEVAPHPVVSPPTFQPPSRRTWGCSR